MTEVFIAIFNSYGPNIIPDFLENKMKNDARNERVVLAEMIRKLPINTEKGSLINHIELLLTKQMKYIKYQENEAFFRSDNLKFAYSIKVEKISTNIPWKIVTIDGVESIHFFNGIKITDASLNMCEW